VRGKLVEGKARVTWYRLPGGILSPSILIIGCTALTESPAQTVRVGDLVGNAAAAAPIVLPLFPSSRPFAAALFPVGSHLP
jgi:hypothetical protein